MAFRKQGNKHLLFRLKESIQSMLVRFFQYLFSDDLKFGYIIVLIAVMSGFYIFWLSLLTLVRLDAGDTVLIERAAGKRIDPHTGGIGLLFWHIYISARPSFLWKLLVLTQVVLVRTEAKNRIIVILSQINTKCSFKSSWNCLQIFITRHLTGPLARKWLTD